MATSIFHLHHVSPLAIKKTTKVSFEETIFVLVVTSHSSLLPDLPSSPGTWSTVKGMAPIGGLSHTFSTKLQSDAKNYGCTGIL